MLRLTASPSLKQKDIYSGDQNIWHTSHEGGNLENPWNQHDDNILKMSVTPENAPDGPPMWTSVLKRYSRCIERRKMGPIELLTALNKLAGDNGVGTVDIIENRLVGMKSRGVYETPGGTVLYKAHSALEKLILDRDTMAYKNIVAQKYSQLVYDGLWFTPLKQAIDAFVDSTQTFMTGTVKVKLYKGNAIPVSSKSKYSLYSEEFATFSKDEVYNQKDAEGFINLFALPLKIRAIHKQNLEGGTDTHETLERKVFKGGEFVG